MFDFQKEVIINSNVLDATNGVDAATGLPFPKFTAVANANDASKNMFRVFRCADYYSGGLVNGTVYKTAAVPGVLSTAVYTLPAPTTPGVYRIVAGLSLVGKYLSDYSYPWYVVAKPTIAEFEVVAGMAQADIAAAAVKAVKATVPADYQYLTVSTNGTSTLTLTGTDDAQIFKVAKLQMVGPDACACDDGIYVNVSDAVITNGHPAWGTGKWLQENLRFPSHQNLRYEPLNSEEMPIVGSDYTQYSFQYISPRRNLHGQGTVGQALASVTTHTFYVVKGLEAAFETALSTGFAGGHFDYKLVNIAAPVTTTVEVTPVQVASVTPGANKVSVPETPEAPYQPNF